MKLPNLLATKAGRLTAFFALYMTEGIPLGFTATAITFQMRNEGVGPAAIGAFVASLYLPWTFKFLAGPFVDVLSSDRWGRRRMWIIGTQLLMVGALMAALPVNFSTELRLFTILIFIHNVFCATQDVAIDALACNVLEEKERGLANGLMFAGANVGQAIGGSCVLYLLAWFSFPTTYYFVAGTILAVTVFVAVPMREPKGPPRPPSDDDPFTRAAKEVFTFIVAAFRAVFLNRAACLGLAFALLPAGAYGLGLALQSTLAVELGMNSTQVANLNIVTTLVNAGGCVLGGWMSDRFGRRRMLALFVTSMSIPTLYLAMVMYRHHWIMPIDPNLVDRPVPAPALVAAFWATSIAYAVFNGLMYGTRSALFMDITTPAVAATQFTAYMALLNTVISYSAAWQGFAVERWGYPTTLAIDGVAGVVGLVLLPLMKPRPKPAPASAGAEG
ncbi:MAG: MFS transporter [Opitutaceae bacterium]|nr:MFS transporter [Opitutaceae bacterium]